MRHRLACLAVALAFALPGCVSSSVVLQVAPDGSGRAVITSHVFDQALRAAEAALAAPPEPSANPEDSLPEPTEASLAIQFGTPVSLESSTIEKTADGAVRTTVVTFSDITQVRLPFPPLIALPTEGHFDFIGSPDEPAITFAMRPHENGDRLLIVRMPETPPPSDPNDTGIEVKADPPAERRFKQAVKGMAFDFAVELDAPLLRTNAPARRDNGATILDIDVETALNGLDQDKLNRAMQPGSIQEMLWQIAGVPGVIVPTDREIVLEFQPPAPPPAQQPATAAAPLPDTEIFLAPLTVAGGRIELGQPINITRSAGYDNQPFFTPDGSNVLFTSVRGGGTQSDIYQYDIAAARVTQLTKTPESEYSPTISPSGAMSVVRVELDKDSTQRLWQFNARGGEPGLLLEGVKPVGYHAWADDHTLALFVLGEPSSLQLADTNAGTARVIATDIGRSLQPIPGSRSISFVQRERRGDTTKLLIEELDTSTGQTKLLIPAVAGGDEADVAWMPDGTLLMVRDDVLYAWRRGQPEWTTVAALAPLGLKKVSRLAVSPAGDRIAIVGMP